MCCKDQFRVIFLLCRPKSIASAQRIETPEHPLQLVPTQIWVGHQTFPSHVRSNIVTSLPIGAVIETVFSRPLLLRLRFTSIRRVISS